ncbi:hypothetical protein HZH66_010571 [Vespula vulgaris]|uniref:Uncharacterized protein n=1 Tax=Vespula vulgaris TaxID=7454 RepID=A0A834JG86_VESVU|nr:hypothetical protein HZH66_010571 [Vespula vulgaris]
MFLKKLVSTKQKLQEEKTNEGESCDISDMCKIVLHEEEERVPNKRDGSNDSARKRQLYKIDKNCHSRADVKGTESSTRRFLVLQSVRRQPTGCRCRW